MPAKNPADPLTRLKEVSVMALIEDAYGHVLFVKQTAGLRLWTLPGGKVKAHESLEHALRRELVEELGLKLHSFTLLEVYDRPEKAALSVLYRISLEMGSFQLRAVEIKAIAFRDRLPSHCTPSAKYFWRRAHRNSH